MKREKEIGVLNDVEISLGLGISKSLKDHGEAVVLDRVYRSYQEEEDRSFVVRMYQVHRIKNGENLDVPEAEIVISLQNGSPQIKISAEDSHTLRVLSAIATFSLNDLAFLMSGEFEDT